jgi:hypothetical protein
MKAEFLARSSRFAARRVMAGIKDSHLKYKLTKNVYYSTNLNENRERII